MSMMFRDHPINSGSHSFHSVFANFKISPLVNFHVPSYVNLDTKMDNQVTKFSLSFQCKNQYKKLKLK